jgi:hypothetical protein
MPEIVCSHYLFLDFKTRFRDTETTIRLPMHKNLVCTRPDLEYEPYQWFTASPFARDEPKRKCAS